MWAASVLVWAELVGSSEGFWGLGLQGPDVRALACLRLSRALR